MTTHHIVIVGGGIAGLSAAYHAVKKSREQGIQTQVTLLEKDARWGGKIVTERLPFDGGRLIIEGGPDAFLATKPWAVALCQELGLSERLQGVNPRLRNTYVLHRNRLAPLPDGLALMIPTNAQAILKSPLISWIGKARMGFDFLLPAAPLNGDESLGAFISRRLGREAYENLIEPLMSGIYAGDGDALSLASTFPYLRDLELKYGSLARGALAMRKHSNGKSSQNARSAFLTPTTGLAEIVEALVSYLQVNQVELRLETPAIGLSQNGRGYLVHLESGEQLRANGVVLAAPAYISGGLVEPLNPELAAALQEIPYASTATISLAYRTSDLPRQLDGFGYVIPRRAGRRALACTWTSTKFPHRAPDGYALLRVFIGRAGQEESIPWDQEALVRLAREELQQTLGITADPLLTRVYMWENSMPQYNLGHPARLARLSKLLEHHPALALAGNGYRGIGVPDCIRSGELAVEALLARLSLDSE
jgi:oxygen-dependent protoporphyrinogen oxidase